MANNKQLFEEIVKEILDQHKLERVNRIGLAILSYLKAYDNENINEELMINGITKLATELSKIQ